MKEQKILFADIDGTLLNDAKEIPKENMDAIQRAIASGHYVVISTGRPLESAKMVVEQLGLSMKGCYLIAYNGGVVYDCGNDKVLKEELLSLDCVRELLEKAEAAGLYFHTYCGTKIVTKKECKELAAYRDHTKLDYILTDDIMGALEKEPPKAMLINLEDKERLEKFQKENMEWQEGKGISFFSKDTYLEYCPLNSTKGQGMEFLCKYLGIPIENTIAAGDERNDIPMLETAQIGVAMKNAKDEVKACADYVTERTNNEAGIAEVIEKFLLNQ